MILLVSLSHSSYGQGEEAGEYIIMFVSDWYEVVGELPAVVEVAAFLLPVRHYRVKRPVDDRVELVFP